MSEKILGMVFNSSTESFKMAYKGSLKDDNPRLKDEKSIYTIASGGNIEEAVYDATNTMCEIEDMEFSDFHKVNVSIVFKITLTDGRDCSF